MKNFNPLIYSGHVYHKRFIPKVHEFKYRSFYLKFSLINLNLLENPIFSINHFNLFSFYIKDHGDRDGSSLIDFAKKKLIENHLSTDFDDIVLHTYPRILGYVFNPVSFWYFYKNGEIYAKMAEVNNTFGETFSYIIEPQNLKYTKKMQVSPFNRIEGHYQFRFSQIENKEKVEIQYLNQDQLVLFASIEGAKRNFSTKNLLYSFLTNPLHNIAAITFIHIEALFLYIKNIPFYGKNGVVNDK